MPIATILSLSFLMPWLIIFCRRHTEECSSNFLGWFFLLLFGFQTVAFTPYLLYIYRFLPGWSTFYLLDIQQYPLLAAHPLAVSAILVLSGYLLMIISYGYSRLTWNSGHVVFFQLPWILAVGTITATSVLYHDRIIRLADYAGYWDGAGEMLYAHPACWSFGAVLLVAALSICLSFKLK